MYTVRGNRGGAETDGRAEDPFEAAARGASASVPWKFFYLTLCLPPVPFPHPSESHGPSYASTATQSGPEEDEERPQSFPWRHSPALSKSSYCRGTKNFPQRIERGLVRGFDSYCFYAPNRLHADVAIKKGISSFVDFP